MEDASAAKLEQREIDQNERTRKLPAKPPSVEEEQQNPSDRKRITAFTMFPQRQTTLSGPSIQQIGSMFSKEAACINCGRKERYITDIKEIVQEKDVFMMAITEDANREREERKKLDSELVRLKEIVRDYKKRLVNEVDEREADFQKHAEEAIRLKEMLKESEVQLELALLEISSLKKKLTTLVRKSSREEALNRTLKRRISQVKPSKGRLSSGIEKRKTAESENLAIDHRKLDLRKLKYSEDKTKRIDIPVGKTGEYIANCQKLHGREVDSMKSAFSQNIMEVKNHVKHLQKPVRVLESSSSRRIHIEERNDIQSREKMNHIKEASSSQAIREGHESHNLRKQRDTIKTHFQLLATNSHLPAQSTIMSSGCERDTELEKWKKLYMAAKTTISIMQSGLQNSTTSSKTLSKRSSDHFGKIPNLKTQQAEEREQHLSYNERIALERHMRVKDERLEALREQLLRMEEEATQNQDEIKTLKEKLRST